MFISAEIASLHVEAGQQLSCRQTDYLRLTFTVWALLATITSLSSNLLGSSTLCYTGLAMVSVYGLFSPLVTSMPSLAEGGAVALCAFSLLLWLESEDVTVCCRQTFQPEWYSMTLCTEAAVFVVQHLISSAHHHQQLQHWIAPHSQSINQTIDCWGQYGVQQTITA